MYSYTNKCIVPGCSLTAVYSTIKNCKSATSFCVKHKNEEHFNMNNKYCIEKDCRQFGKWGVYGAKDYCYDHKKEGCETVTRDKHGNAIKIDEDKFKM
mgnify:FL=1